MDRTIDLWVTHKMGGLIEFQRTGIYPNNLIFYSPKFQRTWKVKLVSENQTGSLKIKKEEKFQYLFNEGVCKMKEIDNGITLTDWQEVDMSVIMID